jgi:ribosome-associated toxin RatA of RatAB toxin-antitoxin module
MREEDTMNQPRTTEHSVTVQAPAREVYALIEDVLRWPAIFGPTVHVERLASDGKKERLRIWAFAGEDQVRSWESERHLDPDALRVAFSQVAPSYPVATMSGEWRVSEQPDGGSRVDFGHSFTSALDDPSILDRIEEVVDRNSRAELDSLRVAAELRHRLGDLVLTFSDDVPVEGTQEIVYDVLAKAGEWPDVLPHVSRLELREQDGVQFMEMDTKEGGGGVHTTRSVRVCLPPDRIVYKQTGLPEFLAAHVGEWSVREGEHGAVATHTIILKEEWITRLLGPEGTVEAARQLLREAIGANSRTTLGCARTIAESRRAGDLSPAGEVAR